MGVDSALNINSVRSAEGGARPAECRPCFAHGHASMGGVGRRTKGELSDNTANVRAGLDEALEVWREGVAAVEAVLEHGRDGLWGMSLWGAGEGVRGDVR